MLVVNLSLLAALVVVAALIWKAMGGTNGREAGTHSPKPSASVSPPATDAAQGGAGDGNAEETAGQSDGDDDDEASGDGAGTDDEGDNVAVGGEASGDTIELAFVGDILPAARVLDLMKANGYDYPFRASRDILSAADIAAGNLETPLTTRGTPAEDKQFVFRGSPDAVTALKDAGLDFLSLANNHTLDYGWEGLSDTMDTLDDADLQHAGSGVDDKEAFSPAYIEAKGITVGFVSVTRVVPKVSWKADRLTPGVAEAYSSERAVKAIKTAKENADIVVVMVHWGEERNDHPIKVQNDLGHQFIDAGADLVIGSHPHVLQGFETYKGKWIAYSLGNFVFTSKPASVTSETGVLQATCGKNGACALKFVPMFSDNSQPAPMDKQKGAQLLARLSDLSIGVSVKGDGTIVAGS